MTLTSRAVEFSRHGDGDVEVLRLGLGEAVGTRDVVGHFQGSLSGGTQGVASGVHVTLRS